MGVDVPAGTRPMRADARRNYDSLVKSAQQEFREHGTDATLEDIAKRAGVGIGTLYRHFPTRLELAETVYREDVDALATEAERVIDELPAWEALSTWVTQWVGVSATKRVIFAELVNAVSKDSQIVSYCRETMRESVRLVLAHAQEAGVARTDIDEMDLLRLVMGLMQGPNPDPKQAERLLPVLLDGIRRDA